MITIDEVVIKLLGRYDLRRLQHLGYYIEEHSWVFEGVMHKYQFTPKDNNVVTITIVARQGRGPLIPHITFTQINDWVRESVDIIDLDKRRR